MCLCACMRLKNQLFVLHFTNTLIIITVYMYQLKEESMRRRTTGPVDRHDI